MATLIHLGLGDFAEEFLGEDGIHDLGNMLSLESIVYIGFSDLDLWFEGTQEVRHLPTSRQHQHDAWIAQSLQYLC